MRRPPQRRRRAGALDRFQQAARRQRSFGHLHAQRLERTIDRVEDDSRWSYRTALTHALDPKLGIGRGRLHVEDADGWDFGRPGQQIVGKGRSEPSSVRIERAFFVERGADALRDAAKDCPSTTMGLTSVPQSSTAT